MDKTSSGADKSGTEIRRKDINGKQTSSGNLTSSAVRSGVRRAQILAGKEAQGSKFAPDKASVKDKDKRLVEAYGRIVPEGKSTNPLMSKVGQGIRKAEDKAIEGHQAAYRGRKTNGEREAGKKTAVTPRRKK